MKGKSFDYRGGQMPTRKIRLSTSEKVKYLASARELRDAGLISEIPSEWRGNRCPLEIQVAPPPDNIVCDLANGQVCYAMFLRLIARSAVTLQDCQILTLWDDEVMLETFDRRKRVIDFGGHLYQQSDILNGRLEAGLRVGCGRLLEGWILASGLRRIPAEYRDFFIVQCEVIVWDPNGREFRANAGLSALRMPRRFSLSTRGSGLYGPAQNEKSLELPVAEASGLPYLELVRQGKIANQGKAAESADTGRVEKEPKRNAQKSNRK
jgi:hypothetical protein